MGKARNAHKIIEKKPFGGPRKEVILIDNLNLLWPKGCEGVNWIILAHYEVQWWASSLFHLMKKDKHLQHNGTYSVKKKLWPFCDSKYNLIYTLFGTVFKWNRVMLKLWKVAILVKYQLTSVVTVLGNSILLQCCMRYYVNGYCHRTSFMSLIGFTHDKRVGTSLNAAPCHTKFLRSPQLKTSQLSWSFITKLSWNSLTLWWKLSSLTEHSYLRFYLHFCIANWWSQYQHTCSRY
jgi:hypothetical protein